MPLDENRAQSAASPAPDTQQADAAFRRNDLVGSLFASEVLYRQVRGVFARIDPDFRPFDLENIVGYEQYADRFLDVFNRKAMDAVKADINQENKDRKVMARAGWVGYGINLVAGGLVSTIYLPGGGLVKIGKRYSTTGSARSMEGAAAASTAVQEGSLHSGDELRTVDEILKNIGGSALLFGVLGGSRAAIMTRLEHVDAALAFDAAKAPGFDADTNALHAEMMGLSVPSPTDAASDRPETSAGLSVAGCTASTVARAIAKLNPLLRMMHSPSACVRQIGFQMMENPVYLTKNVAGEDDTPGGTAMHKFIRDAVAQAVGAQRGAYLNARKAGLSLTQKEFYEEVGRAMRRGDRSDIPGVSETATAWRTHVIEPLKQRAIDAGLLPRDVDVATAETYFLRMWNRPTIEAEEQEFKGILREYFDGQVSAAMVREAAEREKALSGLESVKADLQSGVAAGKAGLADLADGIARHMTDEALEQFEAGFQQIAGGIARDLDADNLAEVDRQIAGHAARGSFEFLNDADRADYVGGIVDDVYDMLAGRATDGFLTPNFTIAAHGPLKDRSFDIPDTLVEKFLEDNVDLVGRRYARVMAADIELAKRFGSPVMKEAFERVQLDYAGLRAEAGNDPLALERLDDQKRSDIADLQATRDMLRGNYRPEIQNTSWARVLAGAGVFNYMQAMGGVRIGSLSDAVRPAMVHGLSAYIKDGLAPMVRGVKAAGLSKKEAQLAGAISEKILASRMASFAGITDPYARGSVFERFLGNMTVGFSLMAGLLHWDDFQETLASLMIQNRILGSAEKAVQRGFASLPARERAYLDFLGIGEQQAVDLGRLFATHGETIDGVKVANTEAWGEDAIAAATRRAFRAAIKRDVDSSIVTKGVGDVPLFASTPLGRAILQFRSFAIASNQRVLIRGLPEDETRLVGGIVGMTTIGAFIYALKQLEAGRELSDNSGTWAMEGLDRSGIFAVGFEVNNALEKLGVTDLDTDASSLFSNAGQKAPASHSTSRSVIGGLLGPTNELASDATSRAGSAVTNGKGEMISNAPGMTESDIAVARRLTSFASLPYWRWLMDEVSVPG